MFQYDGMCGIIPEKGEAMQNILKEIPYTHSERGVRKVVDEKHLLMMQIALQPGQDVPLHSTNSNVHVLVLEGAVSFTVNGNPFSLIAGDILPVGYKDEMYIKNDGVENTSFLVIKTPNPSEMK